MNKTNNGNEQVNDAKRKLNSNVDKLNGLGNTKGKNWKDGRRNKPI